MADKDLLILIKFIREITKSVRKAWNFNLTGPQLQLLNLLYTNGPMRMSDLADEIGISQSGATSLANRMIKGHFIARERIDGDRRVVMLGITEEGTALLETFSKSRDEAVERFIGKLTPSEKSELIRLCQKMLG
ncbi:MarR family winged helix-turn-helix transcriptional regulator [Camelliibacillus cellulosilyticus]|uniref:MarR family winged helix-turn-helix transcriptional regulator n=1 Tax=Camelliibacillus cellulosilyticus TaxID=2174486 RepID=A0ABV9GNC1_9BACL